MYHLKSFWSCRFWSQGWGMTSELWHHQYMASNLCLWKANIHIFICTLYHSLWTLKIMGGNLHTLPLPRADVGEREELCILGKCLARTTFCWQRNTSMGVSSPGAFQSTTLSLTSGFATFLGASEKQKWQSAWHIINPQMCQLILASVIIPCLPCSEGPIYINKRLNTMLIAPPGVVRESGSRGTHSHRPQTEHIVNGSCARSGPTTHSPFI